MTIYKKLICIVVLISFLIGSSCALANSEPAKESFIDNYKEGLWTLDDIEGDVIISSVNGEITHGDRLRIRIPIAGNCHLGNVVTSFLTYNKNTDIKNIRDREGTAHFGVSPIKVNYLFSTKLIGNSFLIWVDLGWYKISELKRNLENTVSVKVTLDHNDIFPANDYFDVRINTWPTNGMAEVIDKSVKICHKLLGKDDDKNIKKVVSNR